MRDIYLYLLICFSNCGKIITSERVNLFFQYIYTYINYLLRYLYIVTMIINFIIHFEFHCRIVLFIKHRKIEYIVLNI